MFVNIAKRVAFFVAQLTFQCHLHVGFYFFWFRFVFGPRRASRRNLARTVWKVKLSGGVSKGVWVWSVILNSGGRSNTRIVMFFSFFCWLRLFLFVGIYLVRCFFVSFGLLGFVFVRSFGLFDCLSVCFDLFRLPFFRSFGLFDCPSFCYFGLFGFVSLSISAFSGCLFTFFRHFQLQFVPSFFHSSFQAAQP